MSYNGAAFQNGDTVKIDVDTMCFQGRDPHPPADLTDGQVVRFDHGTTELSNAGLPEDEQCGFWVVETTQGTFTFADWELTKA